MLNIIKHRMIASVAAIVLIALSASAAPPDDKKKEKKDEPRKVEITADAAKVRAALIKAELDQGYELGNEEPSRIIFRERQKSGASFKRVLVGDSHVRDVFVIASLDSTTTIYATTEMCVQMRGGPGTQMEGRYDARYNCSTIDMRRNKNEGRNYFLNRLDKLLESVKTTVEPK